MARAELRTKPGRAVSLGAGVLVAAVSFGLLSSETATSSLQVTSTVRQNFRAAYDILVRPKNAATAFEKQRHVVDDGFLSGLFGGITMEQYDEIKSLPGVSLAAPVANVGYFDLTNTIFVPFPKSVPKAGPAAYRVTMNWNVHDGLEHYPAATFYLYWTGSKLTFSNSDTEDGTELVPGQPKPLDVCEGFDKGKDAAQQAAEGVKTVTRNGKRVAIVSGNFGKVTDPYTKALAPTFACASPSVEVTGAALREFSTLAGNRSAALRSVEDDGQVGSEASGHLGAEVNVSLPVLVAGVDPEAESALVGLGSTMTSGTYLRESAGLSGPTTSPDTSPGAPKVQTYPVIASEDTFLDQTADLTIQQLAVHGGASLAKTMATPEAYKVLTSAKGKVVGHTTLSPNAAWRQAIGDISPNFVSLLSDGYWRVSSTKQSVSTNGVITPSPVRNDPEAWSNLSPSAGEIGYSLAPPGSNDTWYRNLKLFGGAGATTHIVDGEATVALPFPKLTGTFDPAKLRGFSPLSKVPLQTFYPPMVTAANAAAKRLLGSTSLGPTTNLGGYLAQPPLLLTTLQGAIALDNGDGESFTRSVHQTVDGKTITRTIPYEAYEGASPTAPISTVQVRVRGVTGPNALSLAKIKLVAEQIAAKTGLMVDITAGSSPTPETIQLAPGKFGAPPLLVDQGWVKKDVDSGIIQALSNEDLALFVLVLLVCGLFVASATAASVRQRRREIAILGTFGWPSRSIFSLIVGEAALVGLGAGALGCAIAVGLGEVGSLDIPSLRLALIAPIAIGLAALSAAVPAWQAARVPPLDALRDPVRGSTRGRRVRSITGLALANVVRVPGRSLVALVSLTVGVGALALVLGITVAFRGDVAGDLLGNVVALNVRGVDLASAVLIVVVGAGSVADVCYVNLRERAAELATLQALGWTDASVFQLAAREGLVLGVIGSLLGAALGVGAIAALGGSTGSVLLAALIAVIAGCVVTCAALVVPLIRLVRIGPAESLARE